MEELPVRSQSVEAALAASGASGVVRVLPDSTRTAVEAAAALGCEVGAIANSLVFWCEDAPLLVMTSGAHRVDTTALADRRGGGPIRRATPEQVRAATGQVMGGVAPLGHPQPVTTLVDVDLADHPVIWAAGGTPNTIFPTTYDELVRITGGEPTTVT